MEDKEWAPETVFDVFGDSVARRILVLASEQQVSAEELADILDTSLPTVYRRLNTLGEYDLLSEHQQIDQDGTHYKTYTTALDRITFEIEDGGYSIDIELRQSLVDQFETFWSDLDGSRGMLDLGVDRQSNSTDRSGGTQNG